MQESCPCDFHTKDLTEEEARIALFKPISTGEEAPPLVKIERFHHLWDARKAALLTKDRQCKESHKCPRKCCEEL